MVVGDGGPDSVTNLLSAVLVPVRYVLSVRELLLCYCECFCC